MNRELKGTTCHRTLTLDRLHMDQDARVVPASLSSEAEVERWFGREVLAHSAEAIDLTRAGSGLPLLFNHDSNVPLGKVRNVRLDGERLRGDIEFSNNARAQDIWPDVRDGYLDNVSIGYQIKSFEESSDSDIVRITRWALLEASIVTVPADSSVGVNRSHEDRPMAETPTAEQPPANYRAAFETGKTAGAKDAIQAERQRLQDIDELFALPAVPRTPLMTALRKTAIEEGWESGKTNREILANLGTDEGRDFERGLADPGATDNGQGMQHHTPTAPQPGTGATTGTVGTAHRGQVQVTRDQLDSRADINERALLVRCGIERDKAKVREASASGYVGMSLLDMARDYLYNMNVDMRGLRPDDIVGKAFVTRANRAHGQTTSDFTNLLNNVANKSLLMGWDEIPETWQQVCRIGSLPDFKTADRPGLSHFSDLDEVPEDGDIEYGSFSDYKETIKLVEYAKKHRLTRRTILNDDLDALSRRPRMMGRAANRKVGDKVWDTLTSNSHVGPTLNQDSVALFNSAHSNYVASGSGAAPTVSTLDTGFTNMGTQTDPSGAAILNISPRYLVVPKALEVTANVLIASEFNPIGNTNAKGGAREPNPFRGRLEVVPEARLDSSSHGNLTTGWYLGADPNMFDTIEVAFLNGVAEPYIREEEEWDTRGVELVVGIDCGVAFLDYRGLYFNYGA